MKQKFYICKHCGNIIVMIRDKGVPVCCCGEKMTEIHPGTAEASGEKHIPVYEMEHYIEWICLETEHGIQYTHLDPDDKPKAKFSLCEGDEVRAVYAFCNQHSLWRN